MQNPTGSRRAHRKAAPYRTLTVYDQRTVDANNEKARGYTSVQPRAFLYVIALLLYAYHVKARLVYLGLEGGGDGQVDRSRDGGGAVVL